MSRRWPLYAFGFAMLFNLAGFLSGQIGSTDTIWYRQLTQPRLQPPGEVFGTVWPLLYSLMGIAFGRIWAAQPTPARRTAILLFLVQLLLNLCWSPLFFAAHQVAWALLLLVVILLVAILATIAMRRIDRVAPWLMLPYLLWLGFAFGLNWRIWQLNGPIG